MNMVIDHANQEAYTVAKKFDIVFDKVGSRKVRCWQDKIERKRSSLMTTFFEPSGPSFSLNSTTISRKVSSSDEKMDNPK